MTDLAIVPSWRSLLRLDGADHRLVDVLLSDLAVRLRQHLVHDSNMRRTRGQTRHSYIVVPGTHYQLDAHFVQLIAPSQAQVEMLQSQDRTTP